MIPAHPLMTSHPADSAPVDTYWTHSAPELFQRLQSAPTGLRTEQLRARVPAHGRPHWRDRRVVRGLTLLFQQFKSPIIAVLLFAAGLSLLLGTRTDSVSILAIVVISGLLGFWQEFQANDAISKLLALVEVKARVVRDGVECDVSAKSVVPGDVVLLAAGDVIPGDSIVLEARDLFVSEASITGESFPVDKLAGTSAADAPLARRSNVLYTGTHVVSGSGRSLVVKVGEETELGQLSDRLRAEPPVTNFEHGIRRFGNMLVQVTLVLVLAIFGINVARHQPVLESFLFAVALAVGLTPQLLPAIISVNLSHGARRMAKHRVIVKRLASIENFGSMNVLCTDKTGTLTEGEVKLHAFENALGVADDEVFRLGYLNASFETGFRNPLDEAIRAHRTLDVTSTQKLDEIPYDFQRKRLSILVRSGSERTLITKGAVAGVLGVCSRAVSSDGSERPLDEMRSAIDARFDALCEDGLRVLAVARRSAFPSDTLTHADESDMTLVGFLVFSDPPKVGVTESIARLRALGVTIKIVTGDNVKVAAKLAHTLGVAEPRVLTGAQLDAVLSEAIPRRVVDIDIFAECEPRQKERIVVALRKAGQVVGFLGDGINDAAAIRAADVGISVDTAVDVAKEAADVVLLGKDLDALVEGVREGRSTFANTLKYVFMATSANFGNMFSMAGASLFLPYLPMLPTQILLTNLLTDVPEMNIASDEVDPEMVARPLRWNHRFIRRFMMVFGLISSIFDYATFGALLRILHAGQAELRTGWFVESVISASMIVLVIRTRRPFFRSRPGRYLAFGTLVVAIAALALPFTPLGHFFGFVPIPPLFIAILFVILGLYVLTAELAKRVFYRHPARHEPIVQSPLPVAP